MGKEFSSFRIISVQALNNSALGEALLVNYGNSYKFDWRSSN